MKKSKYKRFFATLANDTRLAIITSLAGGKKNVTELVEVLGCDQSTVSHNLKRLESCHFVYGEKQGSFRYYRLNKDTIAPLLDIIDTHVQDFCPSDCTGTNS